MNEPHRGHGRWRGTITTVRVDRPDGTTIEVVRDDLGRVVTTRYTPDAVLVDRQVAEYRADGTVSVTASSDAGSITEVEAATLETSINPYGATVDRLTFPTLTVENAFDDEGNLRSVRMEGVWGEQTLEVRPDGARNLAWNTGHHWGTRSWDATGRARDYETESPDGTRYVWSSRSGEPGPPDLDLA
jgi:hypothetical protein